jgi:hypothetical protein
VGVDDSRTLVAAESESLMSEKDEGSILSQAKRSAQVLLVVWALGVFYYFYQSQGFFDLLRQIVGMTP